jgi:hypothetical protein
MRPSFERFKASRQLKGTGLEPSIRSGPYMVEGGVHLDRGRAQHTARLQMRTEIIRRRAQAHVIALYPKDQVRVGRKNLSGSSPVNMV